MLNIEIHGVEPHEAGAMFHLVRSVLQGATYSAEIFVTIHDDKVFDFEQLEKSFLRIVTVDGENEIDILGRLGKLGMDMEFLRIIRFVSRRK